MTGLDVSVSETIVLLGFLGGVGCLVAGWALNSYARILLTRCKEERAELEKATKHLETMKEQFRELLADFERRVGP